MAASRLRVAVTPSQPATVTSLVATTGVRPPSPSSTWPTTSPCLARVCPVRPFCAAVICLPLAFRTAGRMPAAVPGWPSVTPRINRWTPPTSLTAAHIRQPPAGVLEPVLTPMTPFFTESRVLVLKIR